MNKSIAVVIAMLFILMLATALSIVWLKCFYLSIFSGIGVIITLLVLHDLYEINARKIEKMKNVWKRVEYIQRERKMASEELFRSYDYATSNKEEK